ncbi:hypothetical protein AB0D91_45165 [Streptomyces canus]|uniref:hypothetical protein n=1 Tax=Streptomyces canus TaxID=58343 RepID=UPI0033D619BE
MTRELHAKIVAGTANTDPAARLATGLRLFVRLAHEDPAIAGSSSATPSPTNIYGRC